MNPSGWVTQAYDMTTESKKKGPVDLWRAPRRRKLFRGRKGLSKYARWAQDLTEEHFLGLLEAVGEYGYRADKTLAILRRLAPKDNAPLARAMAALQILAEFTAGRPSTEEQLGRRVRKAVSDAERLMYRNNICARRWRLHDLEEFRRYAGGRSCSRFFSLDLPRTRHFPGVPSKSLGDICGSSSRGGRNASRAWFGLP